MKVEILKCEKCDIYTIERTCKNCGNNTVTNKPAKYSPEDKYGHYRRLVKMEGGNL